MASPSEPIRSADDVRGVLARISWTPSCVDMGWTWEVEALYRAEGLTHPVLHPLGYRIRTTFRRPDTDSSEIMEGMGRWWEVEEGCHPDSVIKAAWLACQQVITHELHESFRIDGVRVFDPHTELDTLIAVNRARRPEGT